MQKTFKIKLGDTEYTLRPFTIGELRQAVRMINEATKSGTEADVGFAILAKALRECATPPVSEEEFNAIVAPASAVTVAIDRTMQESGLKAAAEGERMPGTAAS